MSKRDEMIDRLKTETSYLKDQQRDKEREVLDNVFWHRMQLTEVSITLSIHHYVSQLLSQSVAQLPYRSVGRPDSWSVGRWVGQSMHWSVI